MGRSYLVFGTSDWHGPWLTEQNLAHALGGRYPVLYLEPPMSPLTPFRYGPGADYQPAVGQLLARRPRREGPVSIHRPLAVPPLGHPAARSLSSPLIAAQARRAAGRAGLERPVLVSGRFTPPVFGLVQESMRVFILKDWVEAGAELLGRSREDLAAEVAGICEQADVVCATSRALQGALAERGIESELLRHGFDDSLVPAYDDPPEPEEYRELPRPLLGYAGRIDGRLDLELLATVAARLPQATFVFIGPVSPRMDRTDLEPLSRLSNVRILGARPRRDLPPYLAHLDCALLPYTQAEWHRYSSPLKLWECLYAGPPIVGSGCVALQEFGPPLVRFASGADAFAAEVEAALVAPEQGRAERRGLALESTWERRAEELDQMVDRAS